MWRGKNIFVSPQWILNDSKNLLNMEFGEFVFIKRIKLKYLWLNCKGYRRGNRTSVDSCWGCVLIPVGGTTQTHYYVVHNQLLLYSSLRRGHNYLECWCDRIKVELNYCPHCLWPFCNLSLYLNFKCPIYLWILLLFFSSLCSIAKYYRCFSVWEC